jgi:hypothetical protein
MYMTYDNVEITIDGRRVSGTSISFDSGAYAPLAGQVFGREYYEASFDVAISAEGMAMLERMLRRMERHHAARLRRSREALAKALREIAARDASLRLSVAPMPPRAWAPGRNPGIPLPRFPRLRCAAQRQSVPSRTRHRRRTWE